MLMEQLQYNLLFRWFVGLGMDNAVWARHPARCPQGTWFSEFVGTALARRPPVWRSFAGQR